MHFNSWAFLFGFLPVTLAGYHALAGGAPVLPKLWLGCMSLLFYGWWSGTYLLVFAAIVLANFYAARLIERQNIGRTRRLLTTAAILGNLAFLGYFKYVNFLLGIVDDGLGVDWRVPGLILPLGISFFIFQKIAYLVDVHEGWPAEKNGLDFLLFVGFFPQLIAGPIVHARDILLQFARTPRAADGTARQAWPDLAIGLALFGIGLFKKTLLADPIAVYAGLVFDSAGRGIALTPAEAWAGALAYTFQIYFDFSGYSDMAIGLARMFGIRLPLNFASPYQACSIIDFWRRWHMSLSRFLRDYVYIRLGGNRRGVARRHVNLLVVMLVGGLWHGAGWTFVLWGGLHGAYLLVNHAWRALRQRRPTPWLRHPLPGCLFAWALTFGAVVVAWVLFRAPSLAVAGHMLGAMVSVGGTDRFAVRASVIGDPQLMAALLMLLAAIALLLPNSQTILRECEPALNWQDAAQAPNRLLAWLVWRPSLGWALFTGACLALSVMSFSSVSEFIYFNF